jgi:hypothetical protein
MINAENLAQSLFLILENNATPIMATEFWATREDSLATGKGGLLLSLFETGNLDVDSIEIAEIVEDLFDASLAIHGRQLIVNSPRHATSKESRVLGDIFTGFSAQVWTKLVLKQTLPDSDFKVGFGSIDRPGLAHGNLIRELTQWLTSENIERGKFDSSENSFEGSGWCNGRAGLAVSIAIAQYLDSAVNNYEEELLVIANQMLSNVKNDKHILEPSLCHGLPGVLVICSGIGRQINDDRLLNQSIQLFDELIDESILLRGPSDSYIDNSWLTGTAGLLWANSAVHARPSINPLMPTDSKIYFDFVKSK